MIYIRIYLYVVYLTLIIFSAIKVTNLYKRRLLIKAIFWMTVCIFVALLMLLLPLIVIDFLGNYI